MATTADGVRLALRRFRPAQRARAVCLCTHAMMANGSYFWARGFAAHLAARGVDTFVLDWRGHGQSVPPSPRRAPGWRFDDYVELDLPAAIAAVSATAGIDPGELAYLGHSLGGLVGLAAFGTGVAPLPAHLSLWATSVWLPGRRGSLRRRALMRAYDLISRPLGYAPVRRLGAGTDDEPGSYVQQLAGWARTGAWTSHRGADYLASVARVSVPAAVFTGAGDRLSRPRDARVIAARLPRLASFRVVGRDRGDALDADHFTLFTRAELSPVWDEAVEHMLSRGV